MTNLFTLQRAQRHDAATAVHLAAEEEASIFIKSTCQEWIDAPLTLLHRNVEEDWRQLMESASTNLLDTVQQQFDAMRINNPAEEGISGPVDATDAVLLAPTQLRASHESLFQSVMSAQEKHVREVVDRHFDQSLRVVSDSATEARAEFVRSASKASIDDTLARFHTLCIERRKVCDDELNEMVSVHNPNIRTILNAEANKLNERVDQQKAVFSAQCTLDGEVRKKAEESVQAMEAELQRQLRIEREHRNADRREEEQRREEERREYRYQQREAERREARRAELREARAPDAVPVHHAVLSPQYKSTNFQYNIYHAAPEYRPSSSVQYLPPTPVARPRSPAPVAHRIGAQREQEVEAPRSSDASSASPSVDRSKYIRKSEGGTETFNAFQHRLKVEGGGHGVTSTQASKMQATHRKGYQ